MHLCNDVINPINQLAMQSVLYIYREHRLIL